MTFEPAKPLSREEILAQADHVCSHLEGDLRPHLLRFLVTKKLEGRFNPPFSNDRPQPTGRMIVFEFYVERARIEGRVPPKLPDYEDDKGKRLIRGLIDAVSAYYGADGPEDKGSILIQIPGGRGRAYEPVFSRLDISRIDANSANDSIPANEEITGCWQYVVYSPDDNLSHCGECKFLKIGGRLVIRGDRRYRLADAASKSVVRVRSRWQTDWCEVCQDGELRFVYHIDIQESRASTVKGFCQVAIGPEMIGTYHLLPPFDADVTNARNGTIIFSRIAPDQDVTLPRGYVLREPEA